MWNAVPAPAIVTRCFSRTGIVVTGTKPSTSTCWYPPISPANSQPIPPMCVNGNTIALRSSGTISSTRFIACADAPTVLSVCRAPFGSAVVPEV